MPIIRLSRDVTRCILFCRGIVALYPIHQILTYVMMSRVTSRDRDTLGSSELSLLCPNPSFELEKTER